MTEEDPMISRLEDWEKQPRPHICHYNSASYLGKYVSVMGRVILQKRNKFIIYVGDGEINAYFPKNTEFQVQNDHIYWFQGLCTMRGVVKVLQKTEIPASGNDAIELFAKTVAYVHQHAELFYAEP